MTAIPEGRGPVVAVPDGSLAPVYEPEAYEQEARPEETLPQDALADDAIVDDALVDGAPPELEAPEREEEEEEEDQRAPLRVAPTISRGVLRRRARARIAILGVAVISAASMFTLVAFHVFAVQSAFQLDKLENQLAVQQAQYEVNRARVDTLSSPAAVSAAALRLHMVRSFDVRVLHVQGGGPLGPTDSLPVPPTTPYNSLDPAAATP